MEIEFKNFKTFEFLFSNSGCSNFVPRTLVSVVYVEYNTVTNVVNIRNKLSSVKDPLSSREQIAQRNKQVVLQIGL